MNLDLDFQPTLDTVGRVRSFVGELAAQGVPTADWTSDLELATHELLENAVKNSSDGKVRLKIAVRALPKGVELELRTWNRASPTNLKTLEARVARVRSAEDPNALYLELMRQTVGAAGSGLGLGRIRAEAGLNLECEIAGDEACVIARGTMGGS